MVREQDTFVSRRSLIATAVAAMAGTAAAPIALATEASEPELMAAVAAYRDADKATEVAEGAAHDEAVKRLHEALETIIKVQARTSEGVALKVSVIVGERRDFRESERLEYLEGEMRNEDYGYDERVAFSIVRDLHLMKGRQVRGAS